MSVRARARVYLTAHGITHFFVSPPFGPLTQTNQTLITSYGKSLPLNKCQLDDNLQVTLEENRCSEDKQGLEWGTGCFCTKCMLQQSGENWKDETEK